MKRVLRIQLALETAEGATDRESWTPDYLQSIGVPAESTIDPFTGDPMTIERANDQWLIYSFGYDQIDDSGDWEKDLRFGKRNPSDEQLP